MRRIGPLLRSFLVTVVVGGVVLGISTAALLPGLGILADAHDYTNDLGTDLGALDERSLVFDAAGNEIGQLGTENRQNVTLDEVPDIIENAVIATEDKTFWTNDGIDIGAVARAALKNLTSGEIEQGGSTITQQLIKQRVLSSKRDLNRKIREVLLALQLSEDYSKQEILEQYLNTVYFGQGAYGVKTAVERYFLRADPAAPGGAAVTQLSEVTPGQAAMLAGLIRAPESTNPFTNPDQAKARRAIVLEQMLAEGYITKAEAEAGNAEPMPSILPSADLRPRDNWVEEVQDRLFTDPRYAVLGKDADARRDTVLKGGLRIHTTLDPNAQFNATGAIAQSVGEKPGFTAALVSMDPTNGAVRAMVAGAGFEESQYNIATSFPGRQAGSTWKVITAAAAMQSHFSANDQVSGDSPCDFGVPLGKTQNAEGGEGTMTIRAATAGSVNCAYARIQLAVGFNRVIEMAKKLGIVQATRLQPILTLTLGAIESTPLEMATVASSIASLGVHHAPYFVEKIVGPDGIVLYQEAHAGTRVLDEDAAACTVDMLRGVVSGGTGTGARVPGWDIAGKTGTTDGHGDAWFLGFTPKLATVVWHGRPNSREGDAGFGGGIPASIFRRYMTAQLSGFEPAGWPAPPGWCNAPGQFVGPAGRQAIPEGYEIREGELVPTTTTPSVVINTTPTTRPTNTTRPLTTTTTRP